MTNRKRAAQCRRLAAEIPGDPAADALLALAEEFEARAVAVGEALPPLNSMGKVSAEPE